MAKFADIKPFTKGGIYRVNIGWDYLPKWLDSMAERQMWPEGESGLDLDPDFQRAHVWTEDKQIAYVEYVLRDGRSSRELYWNHYSWGHYKKGHKLVLVDGKQRLEAVLSFLNNKIPAFGALFKEYTDKLRLTGPDFIMNVNNLPTRAEVLQWYIDLNAGGVVHTDAEIEKVRELLAKETK